jgi:adenosylcobinamide kinase/adenosylcobinamide-phosphate guanylyltransferase
MSRLVFVVGGARSGKSGFAQRRVESEPTAGKTFIATCPALDDEMRGRIERHRADRAGRGWKTVEEEIDLVAALAASPDGDAVLIDCLTLWINNVMYRSGKPDEDRMAELARETVCAARCRSGLVVMVANEVGLGIVPADPLSRLFRDLSGRVNQVVAANADEAHFMVAGLPYRLK